MREREREREREMPALGLRLLDLPTALIDAPVGEAPI